MCARLSPYIGHVTMLVVAACAAATKMAAEVEERNSFDTRTVRSLWCFFELVVSGKFNPRYLKLV